MSRLDGHLNEIQVTLEEDSFDKHETKVMAKVQSMWESAMRLFRSRHSTFQFSFHLSFYSVHDLITFRAIENTPSHFDLVQKSDNVELLDDFVFRQLSESMRLRYKSYRLIAPNEFFELLRTVQVYQNIEGYLTDYLNTVSLSGLLTHDDQGFQRANQLVVMINKYFQSIDPPTSHASPCNDIHCCTPQCITYAYRTLFSYFMTVYNRNHVHDKASSYILASGSETSMVTEMKTIISNLTHLPNYEALSDVIDCRLASFVS